MSTCQSSTIACGPACTRIAKVADYLQSLFLLGIRLYIGYQCTLSGYRHLHNFQNTVENFRNSFHVPFPTVSAAMSGGVELVGGALLLVGLASRFVALILAGNFIVAILAANLSDPTYRPLLLHFWDHQDVILKDDAFPFLMTAVIVLLFGPGLFSLDGIFRCCCRKPKAEV